MFAKKNKGATEKRRSSGVASFFWMLFGAILTLMVGAFLYLSPWFDFSPSDQQNAEADRQVQPRVETDSDNGNYEFYDVLPNQEMATIPDATILEEENRSSDNRFEPDAVVTGELDCLEDGEDAGNFGISEDSILDPQEPNTQGQTAATQQGTNTSEDEQDIVVVEENETYDGGTPTQAREESAQIQAAAPATTYILQINSFNSADEADRRRAQVLMAGVDARVVRNVTGNDQTIYQVISRPMSNRQAVAQAQQRLQNNGIDSLIVEQRRQ